MQGLDVENETSGIHLVKGGFEQDAVVAVGPVGGPAPRSPQRKGPPVARSLSPVDLDASQ